MHPNEEIKPQHARKLILFFKVLWGLITLIIALFLLADFKNILHSGLFEAAPQVYLSFVFGFWGLVGAAGLFSLRFDTRQWMIAHPAFGWVRKRWFLGSISLGLFVGRFAVAAAAMGIIYVESGFTRFLIYVFAAPVLQFFVGLITAVVLLALLSAAFMLFISWPISIFQQVAQFERTWVMYRQSKDGLTGYMVRFAYWLSETEPPEPLPNEAHGARFATPEEKISLINTGRQAKHGTVFGHFADVPLLLHTEKHVLVMASTRSGKGVTIIIPHLLRYAGSAFVLDPKGENARATGRHRATLNNKVHYLDPFGISGKPQARFNPLSRFTLENMEAESKALAAAMVMGQQSGVRDYWTSSAQQLLAAIILHVFTSPDIPPEEKDLPTVRRILLREVAEVLDIMLTSTAGDGLLSSLAASFIDTPQKEFGSILSTAQRETEILDNPYIAACLSASGKGKEVDFADWKKKTMTVYLCLSAPKFPVFNRWLRLVLTAALDEMTDTLHPPALPVCFMLDELATLGHLSIVENAVGLSAGYGVQLFTVFQDVAQMKDLYRGRWASFIGNAGVRALFNLDDYDTAKYWSDFIGGHIVQSTNQQQDVYGFAKSQSVGETMRPLISPSDIMLNYSKGKMLVLPQGSRPIETDRIAYFADKELQGLWDDPRVTGSKKS